MNKNLILSLLFVFCLTGLRSQVENFSFETYSTEQIKIQRGLSQNSILSLLEDSRGFIWVGTWDGLNRFDGYDFVSLKPDVNNKDNSLCNETINALFEDGEGKIWIGTDDGLSVMDPGTFKFRNFFHQSSSNNSLVNNRILSITGKKDGNIYIGTEQGVCMYSKQSNDFVRINLGSKKNNAMVPDLLISSDNQILWVATTSGLLAYKIDSGELFDYSHSNFTQIPSDTIICLLQDTRGNFWVGTQSGVIRMNKMPDENGIKYKVFPMQNEVLSLMEYKNGKIWFGTNGNGIAEYDYEKDKISYPFANVKQLKILSNNIMYSLIKSRTGTVWIGTWRGLNKYTPDVFRFNHVFAGEGKSYLNSSLVWAFMEFSPEIIWVGTENGINVYNRKTREFTSVISSEKNSLIILPSDKIRSLHKDSKGIIRIGTFDKGLLEYNPKTGRKTHYYKKQADISKRIVGNSVWFITEDKVDGSIWFSTDEGINRIMPDGRLKAYVNDAKNEKSLTGNMVYHILQDKLGNIWASSFNGINKFNRQNETWTRYTSGKNENSLNTDRIFSMHQTSDGAYWVATMGGGLNKFNVPSVSFTAITEKDGFANNIIYNILEDKEGNLWLTTNQGITKYSPAHGSISNFDIRDGVQGYEFNLGAALKTTDGEIFVGGMNGFNFFYPEQISQKSDKPNIFITGFSVMNEKRSFFLENMDSLYLRYYENAFSFTFAALDFINPGKISYAYKLEGFDKNWNTVSSFKRYADYTNVPSGRYLFKLRATNSDGVWSKKPLVIIIRIATPFWKTTIFRFTVAILLFLMLWYFAYSQIRKIRRKQEIQQKLLEFERNVFELEQKVLHLQMNPHFLFNTLNSIQSLVLQNDTSKAVTYLSKFSNLMRLILTTGRSSFIVLQKEIELLRNFLEIEAFRFENKFDYTINLSEDIEEEFIAIPSHIIQPFVENSIKHGLMNKKGKGIIDIRIESEGSTIIITITDNGIGRKEAKAISSRKIIQKPSQSIEITRERLSVLNKQYKTDVFSLHILDINDNEGNPIGTKVILIVPCKNV